MQSLYSDLGRQKASNPSGYAANLGWWRGVLVEVVKRDLQPSGGEANSLVLRVDQEFSDALRVEKVGRPAGLGTVVVRKPHLFNRQCFVDLLCGLILIPSFLRMISRKKASFPA
jgi:hypothetical protein